MKMMGLPPAVHLLARLPEHGAKLTVSCVRRPGPHLRGQRHLHLQQHLDGVLFLLDSGVSVVTLSYLLSASFGRASSAALCSSLPYAASFLPYIMPACGPPSSVRCFVKLQSKAAVYPAARFSASLSGVWGFPISPVCTPPSAAALRWWVH